MEKMCGGCKSKEQLRVTDSLSLFISTGPDPSLKLRFDDSTRVARARTVLRVQGSLVRLTRERGIRRVMAVRFRGLELPFRAVSRRRTNRRQADMIVATWLKLKQRIGVMAVKDRSDRRLR